MPIQLRGVSVRFGNTAVLHDITVTFDDRRMIALMGPSGSGKTTLLRVIAGDVALSDGDVTVPVSSDDLSWIAQSAPVLPRRTARANAALGAFGRGHSAARATARAIVALRTVGLGSKDLRKARTLSGGERQRVAVARALAGGSRYVLADEPTASLDAASRDSVVAALRAIVERGGTVLIATHDSAVADQCDQVFRMEDGRIVTTTEHRGVP